MNNLFHHQKLSDDSQSLCRFDKLIDWIIDVKQKKEGISARRHGKLSLSASPTCLDVCNFSKIYCSTSRFWCVDDRMRESIKLKAITIHYRFQSSAFASNNIFRQSNKSHWRWNVPRYLCSQNKFTIEKKVLQKTLLIQRRIEGRKKFYLMKITQNLDFEPATITMGSVFEQQKHFFRYSRVSRVRKNSRVPRVCTSKSRVLFPNRGTTTPMNWAAIKIRRNSYTPPSEITRFFTQHFMVLR